VGAAEALAARRASRTRVDGAMNVADVASDARTGANIRGSSMAGLVLVVSTSWCSWTFQDAKPGNMTLVSIIIQMSFHQHRLIVVKIGL
jgi:hypothetical protein